MVDELPFVEMTILSHITKIDSFDIDPVLLVIKLRLFVFDIRWFPSVIFERILIEIPMKCIHEQAQPLPPDSLANTMISRHSHYHT